MLRNFGTVPPAVTNLVSKCAGNSKKNCHKVSRRELHALPSNRAICRGGGPWWPPPPSLIRVKIIRVYSWFFVFVIGPWNYEPVSKAMGDMPSYFGSNVQEFQISIFPELFPSSLKILKCGIYILYVNFTSSSTHINHVVYKFGGFTVLMSRNNNTLKIAVNKDDDIVAS